MTKRVAFLPYTKLQSLIALLESDGYHCIGPRVRDETIVYDTLTDVADLPRGYTSKQQPGEYRLQKNDSERLFDWANGAQAIKPHLFKAEETLWTVSRNAEGKLDFRESVPEAEKIAVLGARACDIAALYIQDKHFLQSNYKDPAYLARRQELFIVAVNCTTSAATCFCASTGDGPRATSGFDLALTEISGGFLFEAHSVHGQTKFDQLVQLEKLERATCQQEEEAGQAIENAAAQQDRSLPSHNLHDELFTNLDHPHWEELAQSCLSCGNCTAVCPTCFCHTELDRGDLNLDHSEHVRQWDSCFSQQHSYIHGITIRADTRTRYRQWLTHKLASWHEQYGRSGCVGCGRCISWCPVGIDLTEVVDKICTGGEHG